MLGVLGFRDVKGFGVSGMLLGFRVLGGPGG